MSEWFNVRRRNIQGHMARNGESWLELDRMGKEWAKMRRNGESAVVRLGRVGEGRSVVGLYTPS